MKKSCAQNGFTLIELMVTVSVVAIVLTLGIPGFRDLILNNRMTTYINEVVTDVNLARSEAVTRGIPVTLCKRNTASTNCDSSTAWLDGWIVFADADGDGTVDTGEQIIRTRSALSGLSHLNFPHNLITYDARGFSAGYNGTFTFCDSRGTGKAKGLVLSNTGRLRSATSGDTLACS
ncbi:MAG: hypothetical protein H6R26_991 [Proteobacteria bacterium]|nr:hypothetical protein [Pseudomonadota bacterium]